MSTQDIRDAKGNLLGRIIQEGSNVVARDAKGNLLGKFNGKETRDAHGNLIGKGDRLMSLIG